jgi:hypothetical protein
MNLFLEISKKASKFYPLSHILLYNFTMYLFLEFNKKKAWNSYPPITYHYVPIFVCTYFRKFTKKHGIPIPLSPIIFYNFTLYLFLEIKKKRHGIPIPLSPILFGEQPLLVLALAPVPDIFLESQRAVPVLVARLQHLTNLENYRYLFLESSVADPGCFIPDPDP